MEIKLDLNAGNVQQVKAAKPVVRPERVETEAARFDKADALERALERTPDVRSEVVERGKQLVADPAYPPRETLQRIAALLAMEGEV